MTFSTPARIVPAGEADLSDIAALAPVIWRACYPGIISQTQIDYMLAKMYALETLKQEWRDGIHYDCLRTDDALIGFAAYGSTADAGVFKLHKLYLHPDWHRRGEGSRLLRHCEAEAGKLGARRLMLAVNKGNARAIAMYQRNGFSIVEAVVVDIGGGFVMDDYLMLKTIKGSQAARRA